MKKADETGFDKGAAVLGLPVFMKRHTKKIFLAICAISLVISVLISFVDTQRNLTKTCSGVSQGFNSIMDSYKHSFGLMEKYLQLAITSFKDADGIEAFLKSQDEGLLAIEGEEYDGVYMYYDGRYIYSWSTPYSVYESRGYDATKRPWYIGAVNAKGDIFFSVPYASYANDYMLATLSRLQPDGKTVIAYDIKLGEIGNYVDRLDVFGGSLTLICDAEGNVIGSTEHLYQGGNYRLSEDELLDNLAAAAAECDSAADEDTRIKAQKKLEYAEAQSDFFSRNGSTLEMLNANEGSLRLIPRGLSLGYAYSDGTYTCFVLLPLTHCLSSILVIWAATSFVLMLVTFYVSKMLQRSNQIVTDALTGLNNRRALFKYCSDHIAHHPDDELCLIMLDLNDFKQINDRYGHLSGDHALLDASDALKKTCSEAPHNFFLCRYGGDEFLLAGSNCSEENTEATIELIKKNLIKKNDIGSRPYTLEISCGVARGKGIDGRNIERLLAQADRAMYEDKMRMKRAQGERAVRNADN